MSAERESTGDDLQAWITEQQNRMRERSLDAKWHPPLAFVPRRHLPNRRAQLRAKARWWELEALRRYPSADRSSEYAENMRWLVELLDNGADVTRPFHDLRRERRRSC